MAKLTSEPQLALKIQLELSYEEAKALLALSDYGTDEFLKVFYTAMGKSILGPYESGLRSLFTCVMNTIPGVVARFEDATDVLSGAKIVNNSAGLGDLIDDYRP